MKKEFGHFNDRDRARRRRGSHHSDLCVVLGKW